MEIPKGPKEPTGDDCSRYYPGVHGSFPTADADKVQRFLRYLGDPPDVSMDEHPARGNTRDTPFLNALDTMGAIDQALHNRRHPPAAA